MSAPKQPVVSDDAVAMICITVLLVVFVVAGVDLVIHDHDITGAAMLAITGAAVALLFL